MMMQIDDQGLLNKDPRFIAVPGSASSSVVACCSVHIATLLNLMQTEPHIKP